MAKVVRQPREADYVITMSEAEALYIFDALRQMNPTDDYYEVIGGDLVFHSLYAELEEAGVGLSFDRGTYAQPL